MTALRSQKYLAGSRGAPCTLRITGVCRDERETVVPCHLKDRHAGRSIKASDLSVADGCLRCHDVMDRRAPLPGGDLISEADWLFYALRGLQETLERRREIGLLFVTEDPAKPFTERAVKPRKPKADRAPIINRKTQWAKRPMGRKPSHGAAWNQGVADD